MSKKYVELTPLEAAQLQSEGWTAFAFRENDAGDEWMTDDLDFIDFRPENREEAFFSSTGEWYEHCAKVVEVSPVAKGHNPAKLTEEQVGVADGWRLLEPDEIIAARAYTYDIQCWELHNWNSSGWCGNSENQTYRTQKPAGYFLPKQEKTPEPKKTPEMQFAEAIMKRAKSGKPLEAWFGGGAMNVNFLAFAHFTWKDGGRIVEQEGGEDE